MRFAINTPNFEKYSDADAPAEEQLANYQARVLGAELLRSFIRDRKLTRIVVPDKQSQPQH